MVSTTRLYVLRILYLMIFLFITTSIWPQFQHSASWSLMSGVARCTLAALAPLALLGIHQPLKMLPVLLFELLWKATWLVMIGLPLRSAHHLDADSAETFKACAFGVVICLAAIPWGYVYRSYFKEKGDRWGSAARARIESLA